MSLKTGKHDFEFLPDVQYFIQSERDFSILELDESGNPSKVVATSLHGKLRFICRDHFLGLVNVPDGYHWSIDTRYIKSPFENADPVPVEVPEDVKSPETLQDKLQRMLAGMIAERYGRDSDEMETFEDAMDFDMEDEDTPLTSRYDVTDMVSDDFITDSQTDEPVSTESPPPEPTPEATE